MKEEPNHTIQKEASLWALSPLLVFLCLYLVTSLVINDFYKVPISVAFVASSVYAVCITRGLSLNARIRIFSQGAGEKNIMLMIWIFILAGAFAQSAQDMGAVDATVNLALRVLPDQLLLAGIFLTACFISTAVGTSVGTIVALVPVAVGIAQKTGVDMPFIVAIVVGGSFFGDNLSFISDTTIAATQTQECNLKDKFKVNIRIVAPAAILVFLIYLAKGYEVHAPAQVQAVEWIKILPYLIVLVTAMAGMNVMLVLLLGIVSSGIIGMLGDGPAFFDWVSSMGKGIEGMGELIIITMLAGGMLEVIRHNGGIEYIIRILTRHVKGKRGAELAIAALVSIANCCTANNTVAIITVGSIAKRISQQFHIDPRKSASLLDTFSCLVQGLIPYGAQMLIAAKLASVSPLNIIAYLYYPMCMGVMALLCILFRFPRKYS